jgi:hypothetical protein
VILWLNGTFGVGKTTTANLLVRDIPNARLFDAEEVGYLLGRIGGFPELGDFQHWPPWRSLVAETARQVHDYVGGTLVIPQTVLVADYWTEIATSLSARKTPLRHFVLHADPPVLRHRIRERHRVEPRVAPAASVPLRGRSSLADPSRRHHRHDDTGAGSRGERNSQEDSPSPLIFCASTLAR